MHTITTWTTWENQWHWASKAIRTRFSMRVGVSFSLSYHYCYQALKRTGAYPQPPKPSAPQQLPTKKQCRYRTRGWQSTRQHWGKETLHGGHRGHPLTQQEAATLCSHSFSGVWIKSADAGSAGKCCLVFKKMPSTFQLWTAAQLLRNLPTSSDSTIKVSAPHKLQPHPVCIIVILKKE